MQGIDLTSAKRYNTRRANDLWSQDELPWPLSMKFPPTGFLISATSESFAFVVAAFQKLHGLLPDGKLGPATFAVMKTSKPATPESEAGHDFESEEEEPLALPAEKAVGNEPARRGVSNRIIIGGRSVPLPDDMIRLGITASNYQDDNEKQFGQFRTRSSVSVFVLHESVTMSSAQTNRILDMKREKSAKRGKNGGKGWDYGIHLNMAPDGHITCHADLIHHRLVHANQMNDDSFGIEVVNPYNPAYAKSPFDIVIDGPWWCWKPKNRERAYTLPTAEQMRAIYPLVRFLASEIPDLPLDFPTADLSARNRRIKDWDKGAKTGPGIVAHRDFASHADGRYLLEHCIEQDRKPMHER